MKLLQMSFVITLAGSVLPSEVVEAIRRQKHHILARTVWHFNSILGSYLSTSSAYQKFTKKILSVMTLSLRISNSRPSPQGLIFSVLHFKQYLIRIIKCVLSKWVYNFWPAKKLHTYQDILHSFIQTSHTGWSTAKISHKIL